MSSKKNIIEMYLMEVFKQYIALKDDDLKCAQEVFKTVFHQVKQKMGEQCGYFNRYSSQVLYAGSVYDGTKVSKLDEFDMDIVIRLPVNYDTIVIDNDQPGYVKLKVPHFDYLDKQPDWESCHKVTRDWRDDDKYLLQNKFRQWLHGIVQKALNELKGQVTVNGATYILTYKESGPAYTLFIRNYKDEKAFKLDVDLVPVIRFMLPRWPENYRNVMESQACEWLVVPKPNKVIQDAAVKNRCWRLSFQENERKMTKGCQQLKCTIRLMKKLRDSLKMNEIASYYIKTLFLFEVNEIKDKNYWNCSATTLFRTMVEKLHKALDTGNLPYFWHTDNNLIENIRPTVRNVYAKQLEQVLVAIDGKDVLKLVTYLLSENELTEFKKSEFFKVNPAPIKYVLIPNSLTQSLNLLKMENECARTNPSEDRLALLEVRLNDFEDRLSSIEDRLRELEMANRLS